jgi:hypothetical protein
MDFNNKLKPIYKNIGYHRGDLGKAENRWQMNSGRGTGHFGTGTYFTGKPLDNWETQRPQHKVNFDNYKLFRPKDDEQGFDLHESLKAINNGYKYRYQDRYDNAIERLSNILGVDQNKIRQELEKIYEADTYDWSSDPEHRALQKQWDSLSTQFMKALGYQGIDVRGLELLDNTGYGSVIYDLLQDSVIKE